METALSLQETLEKRALLGGRHPYDVLWRAADMMREHMSVVRGLVGKSSEAFQLHSDLASAHIEIHKCLNAIIDAGESLGSKRSKGRN